MTSILKIMSYPKTVRIIDLSKLENWKEIDYPLESGLYVAEWCDCHPDREVTFFVIEKDGPSTWFATVPRIQYSKLIPIAIMAV